MEKLLPQNIEAESGVLGSIIIDPEAIVQVADFLLPEDFYRDGHRTIYETILQLYEMHEPADFITICDELARKNKLEEIGGPGYITSLVNQVPTSGNIEHYGRIVERTAILRRLIHAAGQIAAVAYEEADANIALDTAEKLIFGISQRHARADFSPLRDLLTDYMSKLDHLHENRGAIVGVPTGFTDLDRLTGGLQRSDLIILAARPAVGKCMAAWTLIDNPVTGERLTIEECVKRRLPTIYSLTDKGKLHVTSIGDWIDSGIQPCYRVTTHSGRMVEVTAHHPFLSTRGWIPLHDLQVGQPIAVPTTVPAFGSDKSWSAEKIRLLAYFIASGDLMGLSPRFSHIDPLIAEDFKSIIATYFPFCLIKQDGTDYVVAQPLNAKSLDGFSISQNQLTTWLKELGLMGKRPDEMFFPPCVWLWNRGYLAEYLRILLSCTGHIYTHTDGCLHIEFRVPSQQLAADLSHALVRFGIVAKFYKQSSWQITITDPESVQKYLEEIGSEKATKLARDEYTQALQDRILQRTANEDMDIYWDDIVSIASIGAHQVYDLTVPDGANFVAQDVFVHNTSLALSLAHNAAVKHGHSIAVFSLEMSKEQLVQRLLSMDAAIDQQRLRTGWIEDDEWERIIFAMGTLSEANIWIDDTAGISTMEMRSKARRLQAEHGVDLIVVDYLQLMQSTSGGKRNENRVQEISEISRNLKGLARELNVPVMALAQLSRAVESRQSKVPQLSDLRESGCLTGETLVYLPDLGTYHRLDSLIGKCGFNVLALNTQTWKLELGKVTKAFSTGYKTIFKLTTASGHSIRATANHKFLAFNGWNRLDEITRGTYIAVPHNLHRTQIHRSIIQEETALHSSVRGMHFPQQEMRAAQVASSVLSLKLIPLVQGDIYWDEIVSIESDGEEEVYDLTVGEFHNFIANNIIVHNSIEQDADVVMFIYREDVYNPDTERKNIADIIVAKHRNGPVGEVSLYFQANQTRFSDLEVSPPTEE